MSFTGASWQEIADALGYRSRQAAQQAVARLDVSMPAETVQQARARNEGALKLLQRNGFTRYLHALQAGDDDKVLDYSKELRGIIAERNKMSGVYAPQRTEVDVKVSTDPLALLDQVETALLERDRQRQIMSGNIIEAEVVE